MNKRIKHSDTRTKRLSKAGDIYLHDGNTFIFTNKQALTQLVGKTMSMKRVM